MAMLEAESTLTDRYQTTVPEPVRRALGLHKRSRLHYDIGADGVVTLRRADDDAALGPFLELLTRDIADHPERLQQLPQALRQRIDDLVSHIEVDLDAALPDDES